MLSELLALLRAESLKAGGLTFARFMQLALYSPYGYYNQVVRIGAEGADFFTASQIPLFGLTLSRYITRVWEQWGCPSQLQIVEYGAGQAELAERVGRALLTVVPPGTKLRYVIVETAAGLVERQRQRLRSKGVEDDERLTFVWGAPNPALDTFVIANELLDALPVEKVRRTQTGWQQGFVQLAEDDQLRFVWSDADPEVAETAAEWCPIPMGFEGEVCMEYEAIFRDCAQSGRRVHALLIDYGITRDEWKNGVRPRGTVRGYRQHQLVHVLDNPGATDITADVNWDLAIAAAKRAGFSHCKLESQGQFLINSDILGVLGDLQAERTDRKDDVALLQSATLTGQFKQLVLPGGMGERFSVLVCADV